MINILISQFTTYKQWGAELRPYFALGGRVVAVPFSFRDEEVFCRTSWDIMYGLRSEKRRQITTFFEYLGIRSENISFLDYYRDSPISAKEMISDADILFFLGGYPDRMYQRLVEFDLLDLLRTFQGIVMGYSAGAVIQFEEYYISPIPEYPSFSYYPGLGYLKDFFIEVHYTGSTIQRQCIYRVLENRKVPVYALNDESAIVSRDGIIEKILGNVEIFAG